MTEYNLIPYEILIHVTNHALTRWAQRIGKGRAALQDVEAAVRRSVPASSLQERMARHFAQVNQSWRERNTPPIHDFVYILFDEATEALFLVRSSLNEMVVISVFSLTEIKNSYDYFHKQPKIRNACRQGNERRNRLNTKRKRKPHQILSDEEE